MAQEIEIHGPIKDEAAISNKIKEILGNDEAITSIHQVAIFFKYEGATPVVRWTDGQESFEFLYKRKLKKEGGLSVREELTTYVPKTECENFLQIMSRLGLEKGLVSPATRFEFVKNQIEWSFKLNTQIGNYWEAEAMPTMLKELHNDSDGVLDKLREAASIYNLEVWSEDQFRQHYKKAWEGIEPESMEKIIKKLINRK